MGPRTRTLSRFLRFSAAALWRSITPPWDVTELTRQLWTTVIRCFIPVVSVVFPVGMVIALQGMTVFDMFGAHQLLSSILSVAVFRELAPVLASVLVAAQAGSTYAAELGSMRIREELDATAVMAVDPIRAHVVPRLLATTFATPLLTLFGNVAGIGGGWLVAVMLKGQPSGTFTDRMWMLVSPHDILGGLLKGFVFGLTIGLVATFRGYTTSGGAAGVGRAVNNTVVEAVLLFIFLNYVLTTMMFGAMS